MIKFSKKFFHLSSPFITVMTVVLFFPIMQTNYVKAASVVTSIRFAGFDRYQTAVQIAKSGWPTHSDYVIIATGENFPDALCAAPLAKKYSAPIILTNTNSLNEYAKTQLFGVTHAIIVGGTGVVSQNTEDQIRALGISTERLAGKNRYETSAMVAEQIGTSNQVVLATGANFPDALSIASIAASKGMPILLTDANNIPDEIKPYLSSNSFDRTYVVGGTGVISDNVLTKLQNPKRLYGSNRYDTNIAVLNEFVNDLNLSNIYMATGENFPDALACSALSSITSSPLLLINENTENSTKEYINNNFPSINNVTVVGASGVVSDKLVNNVLTNFGHTRDNSTAVKSTLSTGTYIVGQDIPRGRYVVETTSNNLGNFIVYDGYDLIVNEILSNSGDFGVPSVTVDLKDGESIEISGISSVTFTPAQTQLLTELSTGVWKVGLDIAPGRYTAKTLSSGLGNFIVYDGSSLMVNEILSNSGDFGVPSVTIDLKDGESIEICGISNVIFTKQ